MFDDLPIASRFRSQTTKLLIARPAGVLIGLLVLTTPAAAQTSVDICNASYLSSMVNALIQLSIYGGGIGMFLTYVGTSAAESLPNIGQKQERSLKEIRGKGLTAGLKVFLAGPVALLIIEAANLPWADCITLVPF